MVHCAKRVMWFVTAVACIGIGLHACDVNLLEKLHLENMKLALQYIVGLCGVASLVMFFMHRGECAK